MKVGVSPVLQNEDTSSARNNASRIRRRVESDFEDAADTTRDNLSEYAAPPTKKQRIKDLKWGEEKQLNNPDPGDNAFKLRILHNFELARRPIDWSKFEEFCKNHSFYYENLDKNTLLRLLDIRFIFCTTKNISDENQKFILDVSKKYQFKTDLYFEGIIALTAFLYNSQQITYALVRCISKNSDDTIKKKMRSYFS
jgi:hypothetical protein